MAKNASIEQAIFDLNAPDVPNFRATARKYGLVHTILQRRFEGQAVSYTESRSRSHMLLTSVQEQVLIECINKLSARGLHPTPQILENFVVEIIKHPVGKRWVERFCKHHTDVIQSVYLRGINQAKHITDNSKHFEHYFNHVRIQFKTIHVYPA